MEWHEINADDQHVVNFTQDAFLNCSTNQLLPAGDDNFGQKIGGIIHQGEWAWLAQGNVLQINSLRNGQTLYSYAFIEQLGYKDVYVKYVEELPPKNSGSQLLVVVLEHYRHCNDNSNETTYIALFSLELSCILRTIVLPFRVSCVRAIGKNTCPHTIFQNFDGCLALGTIKGLLILLDLNIRGVQLSNNDNRFVNCHIINYNVPLGDIRRHFLQCQQDGVHFAIKMEETNVESAVRSILPINVIIGIFIGLENGYLIGYDLSDLQIFYLNAFEGEFSSAALVKMDYMEPIDDPTPCFYLWTIHDSGEHLNALLHMFVYEGRTIMKTTDISDENEMNHLETYLGSSVRLKFPLEVSKSLALSCQSIVRITSNEDDCHCLCAFSWYSILQNKHKLLLFDLNQWYREEMPPLLLKSRKGEPETYLSGCVFNGNSGMGLQIWINPETIVHFKSIQRLEEHFYPNALSFGCLLLQGDNCWRYNWEGIQSRVINALQCGKASLFLDINTYFTKILKAHLLPQFIEPDTTSKYSQQNKYEIVLSTALEQNCMSLLRDCAHSWLDGSYTCGNDATSRSGCLSLSNLTDWLWQRANVIKHRCNDLSKGLFDCNGGGYPMDQREKNELDCLSHQLKLLANLLAEILTIAKQIIPEKVFQQLSNKSQLLNVASLYNEVLLWLLNIGILPEVNNATNSTLNTSQNVHMLYPYQQLKKYYSSKREHFAKLNAHNIESKHGNCRVLFIDAYLEQESSSNLLHQYWLENNGDGLYPPTTIESLLQIMLLPDMETDHKYTILLYFFFDLSFFSDVDEYKNIIGRLIKFPSVFKLSTSLIKTTQAFWNLDHGYLTPAVDEFMSPFNKYQQNCSKWMIELFIESLVLQKGNKLALRLLRMPNTHIAPVIRLQTLLANDMIPEAFNFVRSQKDNALLERFFTVCVNRGQFGIIRGLALNDKESLLLQKILKNSSAQGAESLLFVYLLQKSNYIEAVSYMDELAKCKTNHLTAHKVDTPNLMLSAYNSTMPPITQVLTDAYLKIKNQVKQKEINNNRLLPLSCQLIKENANNLFGGIYQSSILSAHFAAYNWDDWDNGAKCLNNVEHLINGNSVPFLRRPQTSFMNSMQASEEAEIKISYPEVYKPTEKRRYVEVEQSEEANDRDISLETRYNPNKRRRLLFNYDVSAESRLHTSTEGIARESAQEKSKDLAFVSQPLLGNLKKTSSDTHGGSSIKTVNEIPSILKSARYTASNEDEKAVQLRFRLPSNEEQIQSMAASPADEQVIGDEVPASSQVLYQQKTTTISESSSDNDTTLSEQGFYSPMSSRNNSILDTSMRLDNSSLTDSQRNYSKGPQPRKPLERPTIDSSVNSNAIASAEDNESGVTGSNISKEYITANGTFFATASSKEALTPLIPNPQESAGQAEVFVTALTSSVMVGSNITEFKPPISSSKFDSKSIVGQCSASVDNKIPTGNKISECSTVIEPLSRMESVTDLSSKFLQTASHPLLSTHKQSNEEQYRQHMLETTLSMSNYDATPLEFSQQEQQSIDDGKHRNDDEIQATEDIPQVDEDEAISIHIESSSVASCADNEEANNVTNVNNSAVDDCITLSSNSSIDEEGVEEVLDNDSDCVESCTISDDDLVENDYDEFAMDEDSDVDVVGTEGMEDDCAVLNEEVRDEQQDDGHDDAESSEENTNNWMESSMQISSSLQDSESNVNTNVDTAVIEIVDDSQTNSTYASEGQYAEDSAATNGGASSDADTFTDLNDATNDSSDYTMSANVDSEASTTASNTVVAQPAEQICTTVASHEAMEGNNFWTVTAPPSEGLNLQIENEYSDLDFMIGLPLDGGEVVPESLTEGVEPSTESQQEGKESELHVKSPQLSEANGNVHMKEIEENESLNASSAHMQDSGSAVQLQQCPNLEENKQVVKSEEEKEESNQQSPDNSHSLEIVPHSDKEQERISTQIVTPSQFVANIEQEQEALKTNVKPTTNVLETIEEEEQSSKSTEGCESLKDYSLPHTNLRRTLRGRSLPPMASVEKYSSESLDKVKADFRSKDNEIDALELTKEWRSTDSLHSVKRKGKRRERRSSTLDMILEDPNLLDSPSRCTRSRMRLNSNSSCLDLDSSVSYQSPAKRNRRSSSSNTSDIVVSSSKRTRRGSTAGQVTIRPDTPARPTARAKSMTPTIRKRKSPTRNKSKTEEESNSEGNNVLYSSVRRLTRNQLAVMEKSASLRQKMKFDLNQSTESGDVEASTSAVALASASDASAEKKGEKVRVRKTSKVVQPDDDDNHSVTSYASGASSIASTTSTNRRFTRSAIKELSVEEEDAHSESSYQASEKGTRKRRTSRL